MEKKMILVLIGLAAIASAALVTFYSNEVRLNANVSSPFNLELLSTSLGSISGGNIEMGDVFGGDTLIFEANLKNRANNEILSWTEIGCTEGLFDGAINSSTTISLAKAGTVNATDYYYEGGTGRPVGYDMNTTYTAVISLGFTGGATCGIKEIPSAQKKF